MNARHVISSSFCSLDDDPATQLFKDYGLVAEALVFAANNPISPDFEWANIFPGEHYRILAGLVQVLKPELLLDIGTYRGSSARVMLDHGSPSSKVITFDLYGYKEFDWTILEESDFESGRLVQYLADLVTPYVFEKYRSYLEEADFIMLDGPKNDHFERTFLHMFKDLKPANKPRFLFIDDIRFDNMQELWRSIKSPKLDLSSFGHFSGTGLVNIEKGLVLE